MKYLFNTYRKANVLVGDKVRIRDKNLYTRFNYIICVVNPYKIPEILIPDVENFIYGKILEVIQGEHNVGEYWCWLPSFIEKIECENKVNLSNNCPECNTAGEYINGAFKCPLCWKVW